MGQSLLPRILIGCVIVESIGGACADSSFLLQTGVYHHVTGVDAFSSASLAAYVNTLTYSPVDKHHKVVSGIYWSENSAQRWLEIPLINSS